MGKIDDYRILCPTLDLIKSYVGGSLGPEQNEGLKLHICECEFCWMDLDILLGQSLTRTPTRKLNTPEISDEIQKLAENSYKKEKELDKISKKKPALKFGQIWSTLNEPMFPMLGEKVLKVVFPRYVVILLNEKLAYDANFQDIRVAPLSRQVGMAAQFDLILNAKQNPLGWDAMIEAWNSRPMLKMNLHKYWGDLYNYTKAHLRQLIELVYEEKNDSRNLKTGLPIKDFLDVRNRFQIEEIESCEYLSMPVFQLLEKWTEETEDESQTSEQTFQLIVWDEVKQGIEYLKEEKFDKAVQILEASSHRLKEIEIPKELEAAIEEWWELRKTERGFGIFNEATEVLKYVETKNYAKAQRTLLYLISMLKVRLTKKKKFGKKHGKRLAEVKKK